MKKILISLCAIFCLFGLTACKDEEEPTKVNMTKEEFYQKLLVLNSKMNDEKSFTITGETKVSALMMSEKQTYKISVDTENNKYASIEKDADGIVTNSEYVLKDGEDYIKYAYEKDYFGDDYTYGSYYVGSDYVEKMMKSNENMIDFSEIDMSSYEKFCESFDNILVESSDELEELNLDSIDTKVEMYIENNMYHFSYSVSYSSSEDEQEVSVSIKSTLKFNDDFIVSIDLETNMSYDTEQGNMSMKMNVKNQYSKGFDNDMIPTDFSEYPQEIENVEFKVYYVLDGKEDYFGEDTVYTPNGTFVPDYDVNEIENTYVDGWYLDKKCTISVDTLTEYPSYDLYLYANTKPNENYALIIMEETVVNKAGWTFGPKETIFAVEAGSEFVMPTEVIVYGNEGAVDNITVDGVIYNESTLLVENGKVYRIKIAATEVIN